MSHRGRNRHDTSGRWSESPWRYPNGKYSVKPGTKKRKKKDEAELEDFILLFSIIIVIYFTLKIIAMFL